MKITFNCCKYLDHEPHYTQCTLKNCSNLYAYWERGEAWTNLVNGARDVQFCKKRGRLNYKSACIEGCGECSDYDNEERTIDVE